MKSDSKVSEKIVDRTIFLMGKKGSATLTVRDIANEAGVNTAAVNYYFDSKEQLFSVVQERITGAFAEVVEKLRDPRFPPEERLLRWTDEIMGYVSDYPGVINLLSRLVNDPDQQDFGKAVHSIIEVCFTALRDLIRQIGPTDDDEIIDFKAITLTSALAQPESILRGFPFDGEALKDPKTRQRFIRLLVEMLKK